MSRIILASVLALGLIGPGVARAQSTSFLGKRLSDWLTQLSKGKKAAERRSAAFALGRMGRTASLAISDLARAVKDDKDASVRDMAAMAIGDIVSSADDSSLRRYFDIAGKALESRLKDRDPRVRRSCAYALGSFQTQARSALPALRLALQDVKATVKQNAAWAIGQIAVKPDNKTLADLADALTDGDTLVRRDAAGALGTIARRLDPDSLKTVGEPLFKLAKTESDDVVRKTALDALSRLAGPEHKESAKGLYDLLKATDEDVSRAAAYVLANVGGEAAEKALPVLEKALADDDPGVQALAAAGLANVGPKAVSAVSALAKVLDKSKDPIVRRNCAIALGHVGPDAKDAVSVLADALKADPRAPADRERARPYEEVREQAAEALAHISYPANESALKAIRLALKDDKNNPRVRQACVWAVFQCSKSDLEKHDMIGPLTDTLDETTDRHVLVRYDAARTLAKRLRSKAPAKTVTVLLKMLTDDKLKVFKGTDASVKGTGSESSKGTSDTSQNIGGDARYMAAIALGELGDQVKDNQTVLKALKEAKTDKNAKLKEEATKALKELGAE